MDNSVKLLSGSEIIQQKLNLPKDIPATGWKEYAPSNSWLEQKQIQACLEDKYSILGVERIEKQNNLAQAEWVKECKKAKVLKKLGKYWEVVGHHQDDEDWLFPEEALYLIEINVLELYHGGVPLSVEHAYVLLLNDSYGCTLPEYRVYSYLSRRGYKLIRHAEDVTVTRYEKQIHLDQVMEMQKRNIASVVNGSGNVVEKLPDNLSAKNDSDTSSFVVEDIGAVGDSEDVGKTKEKCGKRVSDSEDVCIIENNVEVIDIDDGMFRYGTTIKSEPIKLSKLPNILKQVKRKEPEGVIIIDDDEDEDIIEIKQEFGNESTTDEDDDIIEVKSIRLNSRKWYKPLQCCLVPTEIIDLDVNDVVEIKYGNQRYTRLEDCIQLVNNKSKNVILKEMINAKDGVSFIKSPNAHFLPKNSVPKYAQYKINLNMRQETHYPHSGGGSSYIPYRRQQLQQFYNNQNGNNPFVANNNAFIQTYEMRAMAFSMIQAASSLMSALNSPLGQMSNMTGIRNDMQMPSYYVPQLGNANNFTPRLFNNNNVFNNIRNQFMNRVGSVDGGGHTFARRNYRFRMYRNKNNNRSYSPNNHRQLSNRYYGRNIYYANSQQEVVAVDSDAEGGGATCGEEQQRVKRRSDPLQKSSKKKRPNTTIEVIDLCDEKITTKSEPLDTDMNLIKKERKVLQKSKATMLAVNKNVKPNMEIDSKYEIITEGSSSCSHESIELLKTEEDDDDDDDVLEEEESATDAEDVKIVGIVANRKESSDDSHAENKSDSVEEICKETEPSNDKMVNVEKPHDIIMASQEEPSNNMEEMASEVPGQAAAIEESNDNEGIVGMEESNITDAEQIQSTSELTSWQQFKEQTDHDGSQMENDGNEELSPLTLPHQIKDIASLFKDLQIFDTIDQLSDDEDVEDRRKLKISFDAYLPTDHFKKSLKMLPKFRIIVVKSTDSLPSKFETDLLKSSYEDDIPFLYAAVYDDTIAFSYYDAVVLPKYFDRC